MKSLLFTFLALLSCLTAGAVCTASFTGSSTGNTASFTNTSTQSGYVNPQIYYYISFGDGSNGYYYYNLTTFSHNYLTPGTYNVQLVLHVQDSTSSGIQSCTDTATQSITILPSPCASYATVGATSASSLTRTFTANNYVGTPGMTYSWSFGDGTTGTGSPVSHTYSAPGGYVVKLVATGGGCVDSTYTFINVSPPFNCAGANASFNYSATNGGVSAYSTSTPWYTPGYPVTYTWNFGDGSTATGSFASHTYAANGTYPVSLVVQWTDSVTGGIVCVDSTVSNVTINSMNCAGVDANFTHTASGSTVSFTNTSTPSSSPGATPDYQWYFGDGTIDYTANPTHTYPGPGNYTVVLLVMWADSVNPGTWLCSDSLAQTITVAPSPCDAYITVASPSLSTRTFTATSYAGTPGMTYSWNFGDGTTGSGSPVTHTYTSSGSYQVTLIATGGGCVDSSFTTVYITAPFNCATASATIYPFTTGNTVSFSGQTTPWFPPAGYSVNRSWNFGDGSTGTGAYPSHAYAAPGTYTVTLVVQWIDSASGGVFCQDTAVTNVLVANCAGVAAGFTYTVSGNTVNLTNTSTTGATPGTVADYAWSYGDGTSGIVPTHTYAAAGTYTVSLTLRLLDSTNAAGWLCFDSVAQVITVGNPPNVISGSIGMDSSYYNPSVIDTFKVWLIEFDSTSQMLYAVDSQIVSGPYNGVSYEFLNKAPGVYRTKAAHLNGPSSGTGLLPTYHAYSLYWNTATQIYHAGGSTIYKHIHMQGGTVTGGPGFIGGNVTMGANKGTAVGDPVVGLLVFLRDASDKVIRMTYTDASGDFSFGSLPIGNYSVYPEALNYTTTPYTSIVVNTSQPSVPNIFFKQTEDLEIRPIPTSVGGPGTVAAGKVYPNPARDLLNITVPAQTSQLQVSVISLTGRVLASHEFRNVAAGAVRSISVKELPVGLYLVRTLADGQSRTEKVQIH